MSEFRIDSAKVEDIDGILNIQNSLLLTNKKDDVSPEKTGFLITKISRDSLEKAIKDNQENIFLLVARNEQGVVGYFLAYDFKEWLLLYPEWVEETKIDPKIIENNRIIYGKHLASNGVISGIGRMLNNAMFTLAKEKGYTLYLGEICEGPVRNQKSITIHTNEFSMIKICEHQDQGYIFGVYSKKL